MGDSKTLNADDVFAITQHDDGCYAALTGRPCNCPPPRAFLSREALTTALAIIYRDAPLPVAKVCDEYLDRTGGLLGHVRTEARSA